jgi:hypothetical protein
MKKEVIAEKVKGAVATGAAEPGAPESKVDLALQERRRIVRPLPVPHATESEGDSTWALFQELSRASPVAEPESQFGSK